MTLKKVSDFKGDTTLILEDSAAYAGHLYLHMSRYPVSLAGHFPVEEVRRLVDQAMAEEAGHHGADLKQVGGSHYIAHKIRPWDIIDEYGLNFYEGNIVKYLLRRKAGNSRLEELKKLRHYADKLIQLEEGKE